MKIQKKTSQNTPNHLKLYSITPVTIYMYSCTHKEGRVPKSPEKRLSVDFYVKIDKVNCARLRRPYGGLGG